MREVYRKTLLLLEANPHLHCAFIHYEVAFKACILFPFI
jgi:hypothetical protein